MCIRDSSRVGRAEDDLEEVDFNHIVTDIMALYRKRIVEKKAKIIFNKLPVIQTSAVPIRQVFQNLISNGLKYQYKDKAPHIEISCGEHDRFWQFCVKDNGIG